MAITQWTVADFIDRGPWWRNHGILMLNLYLILPLLTATVNGFDSSLINGLQIVPSWQDQFHHPSGKALGLINSAQMIGSLVGLPFTPYCSDLFGRRATLFIGSIFMLGGVATQATASTVARFIGARVLIGAGLTFQTNAAPLLIAELAYPTQRAKMTSFYNASWYIGSVISAWACFGAYQSAPLSFWSWRAPTLVQGLGPVFQLALVWFMPESPRWLIHTGREGKASQVLARFHANGFDEHDPLVVFEMAQIRHALKLEKEMSKSTSFKALIATPGNRRRMMIIVAIASFSQWSGNGLVSYYINLVLEGVGIQRTSTKAAINGGLMIFNLFAAFGGAALVDKLGRRTLFITSNAGMLIAFSIWTLTTALFNTIHTAGAAKATVPFIFIFYFFYDIAYTPMLIAYTLEILPYAIRAKGFAIMNLTVALTLAFNTFVNPWALDAIGWKYCGWLGFELIFVLTYIVETRGRTLEETAALFDGEDKQKDVAQAGGEAATMIRSQGTAPIELEDGYAFEPSYEPSTKEPKEKSHSPTTDTFELRRTGSSGEMSRWDGEMNMAHAF